MTPKPVQFCDDHKKYPQYLHTQINIHFSENPKNIGIQYCEPQKWSESRVCENIRVPHPWWLVVSVLDYGTRELGSLSWWAPILQGVWFFLLF